MAHSKAYCIVGVGTAKHMAQCKEHRAVRMASCIYCGHSNSHKVSDKGGSHEYKVPCTCENKSGDVHIGVSRGSGSDPESTCHMYHDKHGHILAGVDMGSYIQAPRSPFCKSKNLSDCVHT